MKIKRKQEEEHVALAIFCHQCRKKHPEKEFPLNVIEIYGLCIEDHPTNECPSLPGLRAMFKGGGEPETSYPLGDHGDNKTPACLLTQLQNTPNNNGYHPCLILSGRHKPNLGDRGGEDLYMGMSPSNQQIFPPIHNILRIFHSCS
jgi:hypothetical protein